MNNELLELLTKQFPITVQHYKNKKVYQVIGVGEYIDSHQQYVMYQCISYPPNTTKWIRPLEEFCETLLVDGNPIQRFTLVNINMF